MGTDEQRAAESASAAASLAATATTAADDAAREASIAASAAESAAAHVERVEDAIENVGGEIQQAAEIITEQAVSAAVEQVEADLEEENTWMNERLSTQDREIANLKLSSERTEASLARVESLLSNRLPSTLTLTPLTETAPPGPADGVVDPEAAAIRPAPASKKSKVKMI